MHDQGQRPRNGDGLYRAGLRSHSRLRDTPRVKRYARALVWLVCLCLFGQQLVAQAGMPCSHSGSAPVSSDEAKSGGHHAHHGQAAAPDVSPEEAPGNCDCGCPCASLACGHATFAMITPPLVTRAVPIDASAPPTPAGPHAARTFLAVPLRPPIAA